MDESASENHSFKIKNKMFGSVNLQENDNKGYLVTNMNIEDENSLKYQSTVVKTNMFDDSMNEFTYQGIITPLNQNKRKLSTLSGVFSPVALSMFSVLLFLRLGFVVGQAGLIHAFMQYMLAYFILLTTVLSIAAVATNGAVEGGGAYFMISRTLGPEFGGSIGVIFFFANVFSSALYSVGCAEALIESFGPGGTYAPGAQNFVPTPNKSPTLFAASLLGFGSASPLPDGIWWSILYASAVNVLNLVVCLFGSAAFARASLGVFGAIVFCALSVPISLILRTEPECIEIPKNNIVVYPPSSHGIHNLTPTISPNSISSTFSPLTTLTTSYVPSSSISTLYASNFTNLSLPVFDKLSDNLTDLLTNMTTSTAPSGNVTYTTIQPPLTTLAPPPSPPNNDDIIKCGNYTGFNIQTLWDNLWPHYSVDYSTGLVASFMSVFAVIFSGATGIMAGANMSGDLKDPQRSIPKGTLLAVLFTFLTYILFSFLVGASCTGFLLRNNYMVLAQINVWSPFITIGILLATFTAGLSNMIGASRILEAVARDRIFGTALNKLTQTSRSGNPITAVVLTWILVQLAIIVGGGSLNKIAGIVSVFFLLSYLAINISCCALDLASAPNFRPSFKYFSWHTALLGSLFCFLVMFAVTPTFSFVGLFICGFLVALLHWKTPASSWGSLSQALIFHQVRKYLLKLDPRKEHVKYWRPQILQLISDPRDSCQLIDFANDLKKSGLFVLGHVYLHEGIKDNQIDQLKDCLPHWLTLVDALRVKAFVELTTAESLREGACQLVRLSGLGAMKPNIVILGFYETAFKNDTNHKKFIGNEFSVNDNNVKMSPLWNELCLVHTDMQQFFQSRKSLANNHINNNNSSIFSNNYTSMDADALSISDYVGLVSDCLAMEKAVILTRNFENFDKRKLLFGNGGPSTLKYSPALSTVRSSSRTAAWDNFVENYLCNRHVIENIQRAVAQSKRQNLRCYVDVWPQNFFEPCQQGCASRLNLKDSGMLFMLQLACILNMKRDWNRNSLLRVMILIEEDCAPSNSIIVNSQLNNDTMSTSCDTPPSLSPSKLTSGIAPQQGNRHPNHVTQETVAQFKTLLAKLRIPAQVKAIPWSPTRLFPGLARPPLSAYGDPGSHLVDGINVTNNPVTYENPDLKNILNTSNLPEDDYLSYVNKTIRKYSKTSVGPIPITQTATSNTDFSTNDTQTGVCFMYLPAPPSSAVKSAIKNNNSNAIMTENNSFEHNNNNDNHNLPISHDFSYISKLNLLTYGLPPVCLVHGIKSVTTTSL